MERSVSLIPFMRTRSRMWTRPLLLFCLSCLCCAVSPVAAKVNTFFYDDASLQPAKGLPREVRLYACAYEEGRYIPLTSNGPTGTTPGDGMSPVEGFDGLYRLDIDTDREVYGVILYRYGNTGSVDGRKEIIFAQAGTEWTGSGYFSTSAYLGEELPMEGRSEIGFTVDDAGGWGSRGAVSAEVFAQEEGLWQMCQAADSRLLRRCRIHSEGEALHCSYVALDACAPDHVRVTLEPSPSNMLVLPLSQGATYTTPSDITPLTLWFDCRSYYAGGSSAQTGFPAQYRGGVFTSRYLYDPSGYNDFKFSVSGPGDGRTTTANPINSTVIFPDVFGRPASGRSVMDTDTRYAFSSPYPTVAILNIDLPTDSPVLMEAVVRPDDLSDPSSGTIEVRRASVEPFEITLVQLRGDDGRAGFGVEASVRIGPEALALVQADPSLRQSYGGAALYTSDSACAEALGATSAGDVPLFSHGTRTVGSVETTGWWAPLDEEAITALLAGTTLRYTYTDIDPRQSYTLSAVRTGEAGAAATVPAHASETRSLTLTVPAPEIRIMPLRTRRETLTPERYLSLSGAAEMPGGAVSGGTVFSPVYYDIVNTLEGTVVLEDKVALSDRWTVRYESTYCGQPAGGLRAGTGTLYGITEPEIDEGDYVVRAIYTRHSDNLSVSASAAPVWVPESVGEAYSTVIVRPGAYVIIRGDDSGTPEGYVDYDIMSEYHIDQRYVGPTPPAAYVGFRLDTPGRSSHDGHFDPVNESAYRGRVMSHGEFYSDKIYPTGIRGLEGYSRWDGGEWTAANNWSRQAAEQGRLPLHIHHITCARAGETAASSPVIGTVFDIIYPMLGYDVPRYRHSGDATGARAAEESDTRILRLWVHDGSGSEDTSHSATIGGSQFNETTTGSAAVVLPQPTPGTEPSRYVDLLGRDRGTDPALLPPGTYIRTSNPPAKIIITPQIP